MASIFFFEVNISLIFRPLKHLSMTFFVSSNIFSKMLVKFCTFKSAQKTFDSFDNIAQGNRHKNIKSVLPKCFVTRHPIFVIKTSNYNLS